MMNIKASKTAAWRTISPACLRGARPVRHCANRLLRRILMFAGMDGQARAAPNQLVPEQMGLTDTSPPASLNIYVRGLVGGMSKTIAAIFKL